MKTKIVKISDTKICPNGHKNCLNPKCYINKPQRKRAILDGNTECEVISDNKVLALITNGIQNITVFSLRLTYL